MTVLLLLPVVLSLLALAAHFLRAGAGPLVAVVLIVLLLLFVRRQWAARVVQVVLVLGSFEWLRTLADLALERVGGGQPLLRLVGILGGVALATALCALLFQTKRLRRAYGLAREGWARRL